MKYKPPYWFHDNIKFSEKQIQDLKDDMNNLVDEKQQNPKTNISTYFLKDENSGKYMSHKNMNLDFTFLFDLYSGYIFLRLFEPPLPSNTIIHLVGCNFSIVYLNDFKNPTKAPTCIPSSFKDGFTA